MRTLRYVAAFWLCAVAAIFLGLFGSKEKFRKLLAWLEKQEP